MKLFDMETCAVKEAVQAGWSLWAGTMENTAGVKPTASKVIRVYGQLFQMQRAAGNRDSSEIADKVEDVRLSLRRKLDADLVKAVENRLNETPTPIASDEGIGSMLKQAESYING